MRASHSDRVTEDVVDVELADDASNYLGDFYYLIANRLLVTLLALIIILLIS
ncbi:hypothetical protein [Colwellia sp. PAMC 20917]|uniref:hypothetical protein n=1 Tax=Colwellia sp. PAMC 20917 TaxID=1816218 RepID=UPI0012F865AF|nr:hypothetical protein [Colwellia sp. PAMC 20917]